MNPAITIYDDALIAFINPDFEITTVANDCEFTEGPVWMKEGYYLFSDINANCIYRFKEGKKKELFLANSGTDHPDAPGIKPNHAGSNALALDTDGTLLICQHGNHAVAKLNEGRAVPFITTYNDKPLNSPNDIVVAPDGRIFFSDPPYGLTDGKLNPTQFQPGGVVFCWNKGALSVVCEAYQYPNGVCISPDGKELYICSNKPFEAFISAYDLHTLSYKKVLANENSDGMKCDTQGYIYLCNKDGIIILSKEGKRLALISLPTIPANICWGGPHLKDLFITAHENVFLIKNLLR